MANDPKADGASQGAQTVDDAQGSDGRELTRREFNVVVGVGALAAASLSSRPAEATPGAAPIYRIHPAIGVARVGNLDPSVAYFIGPEIPGMGPSGEAPGTPVPPYKVNGLVKAQGARFRIFEYQYIQGRLTPVREVNLATPGVSAITWRVHVANRKASFHAENGPTGETLPPEALRNPTVLDRASLESDFGPRTIRGQSQGPVTFSPGGSHGTYAERVVRAADGSALIDYLGQLRTDDQGRLIFLGGKGRSVSNVSPPAPLTHWSNNNNWFDDVADGPVTAVVTVNGVDVPVDDRGTAWVLTAPPDFAPGVQASISLYDVLYDMGVRSLPIPADNALYDAGGALGRLRQLHDAWATQQADPAHTSEFGSFQPDYLTEIRPVILNAVNYVYVTGLVNFKHGLMLGDPLGDASPEAARDRRNVFAFLRPPDAAADNGTGQRTMPRLYGDNWYQGALNFHYDFAQNGNGNAGGGGQSFPTPAHVPQYQRYQTLTVTQYGLMRAWADGNFLPAPGLGAPPAVITPHGLDRAALENCIGGPFYPGIEASWQIRNPALFIEPFRVNPHATSQYLGEVGAPMTAGHFSRQMALPWQADFNDCVRLLNLGWWPSARPDDVFLNATDALNQRVPWSRADARWPSGSTDSGYEDMLGNWWKFGFVVGQWGGSFVETERAPHIP